MNENRPESAVRTRLESARPVFVRTQLLGDVIGRQRRILHAGPPFTESQEIPPPVMNSAVLGCLFEGWAPDREAAANAIRTGEIPLESAQDNDVLVPLAGVATPSMAAHEVVDAAAGSRSAHVVVNEGNERALRLGRFDPALVAHWRWLSSELAGWLDETVRQEPVDLLPLADESLFRGDDCHSVTTAGSLLLVAHLTKRRPPPARVRDFLAGASAFALNLWMGAAYCVLGSVLGSETPDVVVAGGGNGLQFGIQVASQRGTWVTEEAQPPGGPALPEGTKVLGAIGDSAVVDLFGLGGMSIRPQSTVPAASLFEERWHDMAERVLTIHHPAFGRSGQACGLSVNRVVDTGVLPRIVLGQIDARGEAGRVGGGVFVPTMSLFERAQRSVLLMQRGGDDGETRG
jgi:hypothetical protein